MKRLALPFAALLAMPCSSQEASAVLALHAEARGGAAAIEQAGFARPRRRMLTFGTCVAHVAEVAPNKG